MAANWLPAYSAGHPSLPHHLYKLLSWITTTTTKPFVPSIWGRLHEPKENYAGSGTCINCWVWMSNK